MTHDLPPDEPDPPNALPRGTLLNEKFRLGRVIGVGGFGIVYLAHDEMSDVDVAIKEYMPASLAGRTRTMHVSLTSQSNAETFALGLKSFWNEARLLARFRDEHLPLLKVYDAFQANGTAYMVMPVLRGRTAHQLRRDMTKPPTEAWLRKLLTDLLPALERLHAENVYHRDIAPDNIHIDVQGKPVLMDLGAARHVISNRTQSITAILKPGYAPIEQYGESDRLRQGPWTDIYALGATLHFLLLNKSPTSATARLFDPGTPLVAHDLPGCSPAFLRVIDWMLEPKPEARPQNVEQLRTALFDSDDATLLMPTRTAPRTASRPAAPSPAPAAPAVPPLPQVVAAPIAPTQVVPRSQGKPAAPTPPVAKPPEPAASRPTPKKPVTPAGSAAKSPLVMLLVGGAGLLLVAAAAVWLWPGKPPSAVASPAAASSMQTASRSPPALARPEPVKLSPTPITPTGPTGAVPAPLQAALQEAASSPSIGSPPAGAAPKPAATPALDVRPAEPPGAGTAKREPAPTAAAMSTAKKLATLNDKDGALLPKPAEPMPVAAAAPVPTPPAPAPLPTPAPAPAVTSPTPTSAAIASPSDRCGDKSGFAKSLCVGVVCGLPELHNHAECVAIRRR